jgi:hypothetical protein
MFIKIIVRNSGEKKHFVDLDVYGRIILKWMLQNYV